MRQSASWVFILTLILCGIAIGTPRHALVPQPSVLTGMEDVTLPPGVVPRGNTQTLDDTIIGSRYLMGTTWSDLQQNGTAGKQIAVDWAGWVHTVWTNGLNNGSTQRHAYYNVWNPDSEVFASATGVQVDAVNRGGFVNVATNRDGFGFPIFHQVIASGGNPHSAGGMDYQAHLGAFTPTEIMHMPGDLQVIWPHVDADIAGILHTVHTETGGSGHNYYARGVPHYTDGTGDSIAWPQGFLELPDSAYFVTIDVAAALHSPRVAMAWLYDDTQHNPFIGMNVFYKVSEDGGLNWGNTINVTNFTPVDTNCVRNGGSVAECTKDTLKPWLDLSVIFDQNDFVHIAFMAWGLYDFLTDAADSTVHGPGYIWPDRRSEIWHWDEQHNMFSLVADRWYGASDPGTHKLGNNNTMCQRPSLAVDTTTGYLYCSCQMFDTTQWSQAGYLMSDAYVTVSTSGGLFWAEGTNVTQTYGGQDTPPPGSKAERDIMIAKYVSDGRVHMEYELDHDAGTAVWNTGGEGVPTLNEEYYLRIPADSIPTLPLMPVRALRWDSTGFPNAVTERPNLKPGQFTLYQNYPNPFNPTTTIQFDLASESMVSLRVYDVLGRQAATLLDHTRMSAGTQLVPFDASHLASGVYFYRLETPKLSQTRKMVVMK